MPGQEQLSVLSEMKDEYEDLAESEQFVFVVRLNAQQNGTLCVENKASPFSADADVLNNKQSKENQHSDKWGMEMLSVAMYLTKRVLTLLNTECIVEIMEQMCDESNFLPLLSVQSIWQQMY